MIFVLSWDKQKSRKCGNPNRPYFRNGEPRFMSSSASTRVICAAASAVALAAGERTGAAPFLTGERDTRATVSPPSSSSLVPSPSSELCSRDSACGGDFRAATATHVNETH